MSPHRMFLPNGQELIRLVANKEIYVLRENPNVLVKISDEGMTPAIENEVALQREAAALGLAPAVYECYEHKGKAYIHMQKIKGMCLADMYGDEPDDIPANIWDQVHEIVHTLFINGIQYIDITGYNFILDEDEERVWVIDFGHAKRNDINYFLKDFLSGANEWNPDFK